MKIFSSGGHSDTRVAAVAGMFYPGSSSQLKSMVDEYLANAEKRPIDGKIMGLIAPHAGYLYSGQTAAYAYKQVEGMNFDTVILTGVSHQYDIRGASVYKSGKFEMPMGAVEIDSEMAQELIAQDKIFVSQPNVHIEEHSLEVQIPFLQRVLGDFKIVPILMGYYGWTDAMFSAASGAIAKIIKDKNVLLVASTDMSHDYPYETASRMDHLAISSIENMDMEKLKADLDANRCQLCGSTAVITMLMAAKELGADKAEILGYINSGDVVGDRSSRIVGYFSAVVYHES
jgi:AmmeMemoRadiSam system protein B